MAKETTKVGPEESNRMWASASFVGVLIIIGLPLWWKTTEVYRVALPYDKILELGSEPLVIATEVTVLADDEPTASEIAGIVEEALQTCDHLDVKVTKKVMDDDLHRSLSSVADDLEALELVSETLDLGRHNHVYLVQRRPLLKDVWMSTERAIFFKDTNSGRTAAEVLSRWVLQCDVLHAAAGGERDRARSTRVPPAPAYHLVLSVVSPRPDLLHVDFDAQREIQDYIGSFVDELSDLHNFTLKSQWLHLLEFDFQENEVKDASSEWGSHFAVSSDRLPQLLTLLEARAATQVSQHPTLNLALYAQRCGRAPLRIYHDGKAVSAPTQAFMSARWGGVVLANPSFAECREELEGKATSSTLRPQVRQVMGTFLAQLRELLGIVRTETIEGASLEPLRGVAPRRWETDALLRLRTLEHLASAQLTLRSLAQLLGEISNIVINDEVGASIASSVAQISAARLSARAQGGGSLLAAHRQSQGALVAAEAAFVDPSLLALLYFPDDQKYAIYIPLFLPIMFPVILSLKNLLLWLRGKPLAKEKID